MAKYLGKLLKKENIMEINVTELEQNKLFVHCEANAAEIKDKKSEVLKAFKKAPVPGYREGKADELAIRLHYAKQIDESLKRALAEDSWHNTLFEKKLKPHGAPNFKNLLLDGSKFTCEFEIHTKPDFDLLDWKSLEIPTPHVSETVEEVSAKMLQELRTRLGESIPYGDNDFVQHGDSVIVDYEGFVDGKKVDSISVEGEMMTVGDGPLPGFDSNLLGMKPGETREFDFVAPESGLPSLSGKTIHFKVTLNTGAKTLPCGLDDELAIKLGKSSFQELQEFVNQSAFSRVENLRQFRVQEAVAAKLVDGTVVSVPNWMSLSEAQYLAQQSKLDWNVMSDLDKEKFIVMAEKNVKLALVLDRVRDTEPESQLTDQEVFSMIKNNLANTKTNENLDDVIQQMSKTGYLQILFSRIKDENAMRFIIKNIKLID